MTSPTLTFIAFTLLSLFAFANSFEPPEPYVSKCLIGYTPLYDPSKAKLVKTYKIELNDDPFDRWREVAADFKDEITELIDVIKELSFPFFHGKLVQFVDKYFKGWDMRLGYPYTSEIAGIANVTGKPLGEVVLYNVFYELFTVCTSIVAEDPNGKLYHARNLDFGLFMGWNESTHQWLLTEKLRPLIINVDWTKDGKLLYKSVNFAGYIGVYNAVKKGALTLTLNERFNLDGGYVGLVLWLLGLTPEASFATFLTREVMEKSVDYQSAYDQIMERPLIAPAYFILGGPKSGQGSIVARGRTKSVETVHLNSSNAENGWFLLQTNYDPSTLPLFLDDRRTPGRHCMLEMGQKNVDNSNLFQVLSSKNTLNKLTAYTTLMQVDEGSLETYLQTCPDPCWAW